MNKLNSAQEVQLRLIAKAIFELTKISRSPEQLEGVLALASKLANLVDHNESRLNADLGQNLVEFVLLTIDDVTARAEQSGDAKRYQKNIEHLLSV